MTKLEVVSLEWVLSLIESPNHPLPTPSATRITLAIFILSILAFIAALGLNNRYWAEASYVLAICAVLLELLLSAFGFLRKLRNPSRARAKEIDRLFAQEQKAVAELAAVPAMHLIHMRDRVKLELDQIESKLNGAPRIIAIGGAFGPLIALMIQPDLAGPAAQAAGFGAALSFGALLGASILNGIRLTWARAHFVLGEAIDRTSDCGSPEHRTQQTSPLEQLDYRASRIG